MINREYARQIKEFLNSVEEKLPSWLKDNHKEKKDILTELEEHIWDKAEELAQGREISAEHIAQAIAQMGTPEAICKEYKKRGTPFVYISKEWWSLFTKVQTIGLAIMASINVIVFAFSLISKPFWESLVAMLSGFFSSGLIVAMIITAVFVGLSMEGYLPQRFFALYGRNPEVFSKDPAEVEAAKRRLEELSGENCDETPKKRHTSSGIDWVQYQSPVPAEKPAPVLRSSKAKPPINTKSLLSTAIWGFIWGFLYIYQPILAINEFLCPEILEFIRWFGIIQIAMSVLRMGQVFAGVQRVGQQRFFVLALLVVNLLNIPIILSAIDTPAVLAWFDATIHIGNPARIFVIIMYIAIFGHIMETLESIGLIVAYQSRLDKYNANYYAMMQQTSAF